jgi:alanine-glyoxylate transaminase/serine-glyoxylate transaminase/serine-pyruvate transaminase
VAPGNRLPQLNTIRVPDGIDEAAVRARMLSKYALEIGAGLGPLKGQIWRVGLMGASATPWHVRLALTALTEALAAQNYPDVSRVALAAADAKLGGG